ncbi:MULTISPECIES: HEPN domain-containing protein [unclassified Caballeronia]|uniref:HEPN domain-containing protein n=1 Tax=unclassified Caballeronia TaxID=2646786 RepID=UPI000550F57A|nr:MULTISPECIES: HEPN domain-containing protein [unclassified Caballeronia]MCE4546509.1 HEPN domain-containing protein [Caballeronia sp. PC1]MCE4573018.1 HEPN domain-containing protein [Caballeronia sp. CLC5]
MSVLPATQEEFVREMERIDARLREAQVAIHARSFTAVFEYAKTFGLSIPLDLPARPGRDGVYVGVDAAAHIKSWYDERYGARQNILMGLGSTMLVLKGDPWELRLPRIFGEIRCVVERDLTQYENNQSMRAGGPPPTMNILPLISDLPAGLAAKLTASECDMIGKTFRRTLNCMQAIESMSQNAYVPEALSDIHAAVKHVFSVPPHYGQSKWSSAQAAEKILKSFLKMKLIDFPRNHNIRTLAGLAETGGMRPLEELAIRCLQTPADVRYGETSVSLEEAVEAHYGSLLLGQRIFEAMIDV